MAAEVTTDMIRDTKIINFSTEEKLTKLGCLAWRREGLEDLLIVCKYLKGECPVTGQEATGINGTGVSVIIRKLFSVLKVTKHWQRVHEEAVDLHPWNNQKLSEHSSGQPALCDPA